MKSLTPFPWRGAKKRIIKRLTRLVDACPHREYVEAFGGSATLLFAKQPSEMTVYNDLDDRLSDFFRVLVDDKKRKELVELAATAPPSRTLYREAKENWINSDNIARRAFALFYIQNFSYGGTYFGPFSISTTRGKNRVEAYNRQISRLDSYAKTFRGATIESLDYRELIKRYDSPETLFYVDPPYICSRRTFYRKDLPDVDHRELAETLLTIRGSVILSCYDAEAYSPLLDSGFERVQINTRSTIQNQDNRKEVVETVYVKRNAKKQWLLI